MLIHQNARIHASILNGDDTLEYTFSDTRCGYLHVALGSVTVNNVALRAGDAIKIVNEPKITVSDASNAEILLFDLPL